MNAPVRCAEIATAGGRRFGVAILDHPRQLNALSLAMIRGLTAALRRWEDDGGIVGVVLQGAGLEAFCAGGDLREIYASLRTHPAGAVGADVRALFAEEYVLDYLLHTYTKPVLSWGHGIVMGGGLGLLAASSHRVVLPDSRLAMPELAIGMYPDAGGTWFLGLTGVTIDAADALYAGLATAVVAEGSWPAVRAAIVATSFTGSRTDDDATLTRILSRLALAPRVANLERNAARIAELVAGENLGAIMARIAALHTDDDWLRAAAARVATGSPTSAALTFAVEQRARGLGLADVFRLELDASLGILAHHDFGEGIRAALIDKDRSPRWQPATLAEVTPELVADHLRPRHDGSHPLAGLEEQRAARAAPTQVG